MSSIKNQCDDCGKICRDLTDLKRHQNKKKKCYISNKPDNVEFYCKYCNHTFTTKKSLNYHLTKCLIKKAKENEREQRKQLLITNNYDKPNLNIPDIGDLNNFYIMYNLIVKYLDNIMYFLIEKIYFNPDLPENYCIYCLNKNEKTVMFGIEDELKKYDYNEAVSKIKIYVAQLIWKCAKESEQMDNQEYNINYDMRFKDNHQWRIIVGNEMFPHINKSYTPSLDEYILELVIHKKYKKMVSI